MTSTIQNDDADQLPGAVSTFRDSHPLVRPISCCETRREGKDARPGFHFTFCNVLAVCLSSKEPPDQMSEAVILTSMQVQGGRNTGTGVRRDP
jgi:hypothetical protein